MGSVFRGVTQRSAAYRATSNGTDESTRVVLEFWRANGGATPVSEGGNTILHFLAIHGNVAAMKALVNEGLIGSDDLRRKNVSGDTPLHEAARFGHADVADIMLGIEPGLVFEGNYSGETPLYVAASSGCKPVFDLLVNHDSDMETMRLDGCTILHAAVMKEHYSLAIVILELYPELACKRDNGGMMALNVLATKKYSFRSGSCLVFRDLGRIVPSVFMQLLRAFIYSCIPAMYMESKHPYENNVILRHNRCLLSSFILGNGWLREIDDAKQRHTLAIMLARRLVRKEYWSYGSGDWGGDSRSTNPLIQAAKFGIDELVMEILNMYPEAVESVDENGRTIMHIIAEQKNRTLYDYVLKHVGNRDRMLSKIDFEGNTILHAATTVGMSPYVPQAVIYQMAWDMLWFKNVKHDVHPSLWNEVNARGKTAEEVYKEAHSGVRDEAEKTIREMANGALIVAALLGTIDFAAVFTIPGGFDSNDGTPVLTKNHQPDLRLLIIYLILALVFCAYAIGFMLAILLSKFNSEDFHVALPLKYIIAAVSQACAFVFTILAVYKAVFLEGLMTHRDFSVWIFPTVIGMLALILVVFSDVYYLPFDYVYCVVRRSFSYKSQYV